MLRYTLLFTVCLFSYAWYTYQYLPLKAPCDSELCDEIVTNCLRTDCMCALHNVTCCSDCVSCLGPKYEDCCSCLNCANCPQGKHRLRGLQGLESHVEEFEGAPKLFNILTAKEPRGFGWQVYTFPLDLELGIKVEQNVEQRNCTVVYLNRCVSWNKCRHNCKAIGASSYRWFHDACCQCVGPGCLNYGLNESRCSECPEPEDYYDDDDGEEYLDF